MYEDRPVQHIAAGVPCFESLSPTLSDYDTALTSGTPAVSAVSAVCEKPAAFARRYRPGPETRG